MTPQNIAAHEWAASAALGLSVWSSAPHVRECWAIDPVAREFVLVRYDPIACCAVRCTASGTVCESTRTDYDVFYSEHSSL